MKFIRRFLVLILTFILIFSISYPSYIYASDTTDSSSPDPSGWNSWSLDEKTDFVLKQFVNLVSGFTGLINGNQDFYREIVLDFYASRPESGVTNFYEYLAKGLSFDDDTRTWELSDDLVDFFNALIVDYNDRVTMTYKYVVNPDNLDYSIFEHKAAYEELYKFIKSHPQYYFKCYVKANERWGSSCIWLQVFVFDSAVSANYNLTAASCSLYDSGWNSPVKSYQIGINDIDSDTGQYWAYSPVNSPANTQTGKTAAEIDDLLDSGSIGSTQKVSSGVLVSSRFFKTTLISNCIFSFNDNAVNCYKSVSDMKKDIGSQFIGRYSDGYTGTTINNVSQDTINNIVNNYYPKDPDVDPDDPDSESSSIKKILNDILDEIKESNKHLEKIIKQLRLNNFLTGVDTILDALDLFYDVLNGELSDLASNIFTDNADQFNAVSGQLSKKFPFSLPYDLQAILYILVAEPVDPVFDIPFKAGSSFSSSGYLIDESIHLDFTEFSQSVSVLHFFIKLYWIVALLLLTPKVIHRNGGA